MSKEDITSRTQRLEDPFVAKLFERMKQENPEAARAVRPLKIHEGEMFEINVADLREACSKNPNHPKAKDFLRNVANFLPNQLVVVEKVDLEALLKGKNVVFYKDKSVIPASGSDPAGLHDVQRKALEDDPNIAGLSTSPVPFSK